MTMTRRLNILAAVLLQGVTAYSDQARSIMIMNESSRRIEVNWVDPVTGEMVLQSEPDILNGASLALDSFVGHTFEVRELPAKKTGICAGNDQTCRINHFTVSSNNDQVIVINDGIKVDHTDSRTIASNSAKSLLSTCKTTVQRQLLDINAESLSVPSVLDSFSDCVEKGIVDEIEKANEEVTFQASVRTDMGELLENYTCADATLNTTDPVRTEYWRNKKVEIMMERSSFKIHTIENFVTPEECQAASEIAEPILEDAEVADGSGGGQISENRKAKQAGIAVNWDEEEEGDLIAQLSRRVYDYVNHALPFDIKENGQEDLMSIQYTGRGPGDDHPDQYMPHCDEDCTGMAFKPGTRMATIVMYCEVPTVGGATNFRNANVHIKPTQYAATFFSYVDPVTMKMDSGFTEHSGCPVIEGKKKIVTQWIRLGVDDDNPWDSFNTLGVKISDAENQ